MTTNPLAAQPRVEARPWQGHPLTQIAAALALVLPMAVVASWMQSTQEGGLSLRWLFLGPLLGGGTLTFWILALHLVVCGDDLEVFGFRKDRATLDVLLGIGLAALTLGFHFTAGPRLTQLFPPRPPAAQIVELIQGVARDPWLLALWLGPTVWIGIALFEELARAFLLRRLMWVWSGAVARWGAIVLVSVFVGLMHIYQGPAAVLSIALKSVLMCWVFVRTGRIRVLIIAHALYDSVQIVQVVMMIRQMES